MSSIRDWLVLKMLDHLQTVITEACLFENYAKIRVHFWKLQNKIFKFTPLDGYINNIQVPIHD